MVWNIGDYNKKIMWPILMVVHEIGTGTNTVVKQATYLACHSLVLDGFNQLLSFFLHCPLSLAVPMSINLCNIKCRERRESNPGRLGAKRERFHCAMPSQQIFKLRNWIHFCRKKLRLGPIIGTGWIPRAIKTWRAAKAAFSTSTATSNSLVLIQRPAAATIAVRNLIQAGSGLKSFFSISIPVL